MTRRARVFDEQDIEARLRELAVPEDSVESTVRSMRVVIPAAIQKVGIDGMVASGESAVRELGLKRAPWQGRGMAAYSVEWATGRTKQYTADHALLFSSRRRTQKDVDAELSSVPERFIAMLSSSTRRRRRTSSGTRKNTWTVSTKSFMNLVIPFVIRKLGVEGIVSFVENVASEWKLTGQPCAIATNIARWAGTEIEEYKHRRRNSIVREARVIKL
jgi:hypothetical protein